MSYAHRLLTLALCCALVFARGTAHAQDNRPDVVIDEAARTLAITNLAREVESTYPDVQVAARVAAEVRKAFQDGRYNLTSARALAAALTTDLRRTSGDPHMSVDYFVVARTFPSPTATDDPVSEADRHLALKLQNYGFARVERLAGNVGYLKLDRFEDPAIAGATAAAAMQFLAGTDALIIDLRDNGGGYGTMETLLASYFFAEPTHLSDRTGRNASDLWQAWTYAAVAGPRYLDRPVYVLSGPRTFSAGEALAYDLQAQKRATLIGETTRGGANTASRLLLSSRFGVIIPNARVRNSVTGTNWEGGLKPDIPVTASQALATAHQTALEAIAAKHRDDPLTTEIEKKLAALKTELATPAKPD